MSTTDDHIAARYDPPRDRFIPDTELVARAHNALLESETQREAFIRQHWETACAGTRVALDALREIYPVDRDGMSLSAQNAVSTALEHLTGALGELQDASLEMLGDVMWDVLRGHIDTLEDLERALG